MIKAALEQDRVSGQDLDPGMTVNHANCVSCQQCPNHEQKTNPSNDMTPVTWSF